MFCDSVGPRINPRNILLPCVQVQFYINPDISLWLNNQREIGTGYMSNAVLPITIPPFNTITLWLNVPYDIPSMMHTSVIKATISKIQSPLASLKPEKNRRSTF
jgi:hypothetical protein